MAPSCSRRVRVVALATCTHLIALVAPAAAVELTHERAHDAASVQPSAQPAVVERVATAMPVAAGSPEHVAVIVELDLDRPAPAQLRARQMLLLQRLDARLQSFEALAASVVPGARTVHRYRAALGGLAMLVPRARVADLAALEGVRAVRSDVLLQPQTDASVALVGAPRVWQAGDGSSGRGEGVLIGVLDTGIWPEHPCFTDPDADGVDYPELAIPRACELEDAAGRPYPCNDKLVGAHRFLDMHDAVFAPTDDAVRGARDDEGHGTHTAAIAACNTGTEATVLGIERGTISGVAPRARLIAYKVCGSGGCLGSDVVAAVDRAILDGVDVINFSVSGGRRPFSSAVELAFLDAYEAGIFVAAAAGNHGPAAETVDHRGPWVTSVAATTSDRAFVSTLAVHAEGGGELVVEGAGLTAGLPWPAPIVVPAEHRQCSERLGESDGVARGAVVVCDRGSFARVSKGYNAAAAGAGAMLLRNLVREGVAADSHHLPAVHLEFDAGAALAQVLDAGAAATATISRGERRPRRADVVAPFSARGGPGLVTGVVKPDIAAPGVQILAAHVPEPRSPAVFGPAGELFQVLQGTSMSSPHVAGAAASIAALREGWTPGQIQSALLLTARARTLTVAGGSRPARVYDGGAGRLDLAAAIDPGLTISAAAAEYRARFDDPWNANHPSAHLSAMPGRMSIVRRLRGEAALDEGAHGPLRWRLRLVKPDGIRARVRPRRVELAPAQEVAVRLRVDARALAPGSDADLTLVARASGRTLRMPVTLAREDPPVRLAKACAPQRIAVGETATCTITAANATPAGARVSITDSAGGPAAALGLVAGSVRGAQVVETSRRDLLEASVALAPAAGFIVSLAVQEWRFGYVPLSSLAGVEPLGAVLDDEIVTVETPEIVFGGRRYTRVGFASNGFVALGGGDAAAAQAAGAPLPDPGAPNAVIAPCWADLDPSSGGEMRVHTVAASGGRWTVFDWEDVVFKGGGTVSCQVWFGHDGMDDVALVYGPMSSAAAAAVTVGAEDGDGLAGATLFDASSSAGPRAGLAVAVTSRAAGPGAEHFVEYRVRGREPGVWQGCARMRSEAFEGTTFACAPVTVVGAVDGSRSSAER